MNKKCRASQGSDSWDVIIMYKYSATRNRSLNVKWVKTLNSTFLRVCEWVPQLKRDGFQVSTLS